MLNLKNDQPLAHLAVGALLLPLVACAIDVDERDNNLVGEARDATVYPPVERELYAVNVEHSGLCLDVPNGSWANGEPVNQFPCNDGVNQLWFPLSLGGDHWALVNGASGKCLDRPWGYVANGVGLQQFTCHLGHSQAFRPHWNSQGGRWGTWQWEAIDATTGQPSGQCLDVAGSDLGVRQIQMFECKEPGDPGLDNQVFVLGWPTIAMTWWQELPR